MTTESSASKEASKPESKKSSGSVVIVELAKRRSVEQIRRLRKGRGKLVSDIDEVLGELVESGTIKADTPPVVIVVRESSTSLLLSALQEEDDDDDEEDEDEDDEDEDDEDEDDED
jgi:hypothetical protein